eukprot:4449637-Amphidinium_carterae.1
MGQLLVTLAAMCAILQAGSSGVSKSTISGISNFRSAKFDRILMRVRQAEVPPLNQSSAVGAT